MFFFLRNALGSSLITWDWSKILPGNLDNHGNKIKTKSQNVFRVSSYFYRSYKEKTGRGYFWPSSILDSVKAYIS